VINPREDSPYSPHESLTTIGLSTRSLISQISPLLCPSIRFNEAETFSGKSSVISFIAYSDPPADIASFVLFTLYERLSELECKNQKLQLLFNKHKNPEKFFRIF